MTKSQTLTIGAGAALGLAAIWWLSRPGTAKAIGGAAIDMADGVIAGAVETVGEIVGIPVTNMTECEKAKAEGRTWDASFACPAGDFLKYLWGGK